MRIRTLTINDNSNFTIKLSVSVFKRNIGRYLVYTITYIYL